MAQITTVALAARDVKQYTGAVTDVKMSFSATQLAANVTNADRVKICSLPANAHIIGASMRVVGTSAVTGILNLQVMEPTGNAIILTGNLAPSIAANVMMTVPHSPITSVTGTRDLEIVVTTGGLGSTVSGNIWYVDCQYAYNP